MCGKKMYEKYLNDYISCKYFIRNKKKNYLVMESKLREAR